MLRHDLNHAANAGAPFVLSESTSIRRFDQVASLLPSRPGPSGEPERLPSQSTLARANPSEGSCLLHLWSLGRATKAHTQSQEQSGTTQMKSRIFDVVEYGAEVLRVKKEGRQNQDQTHGQIRTQVLSQGGKRGICSNEGKQHENRRSDF